MAKVQVETTLHVPAQAVWNMVGGFNELARWHPAVVYYGVLGFNLVLTAAVAESSLLWAGVAVHLPLAVLVVSCLAFSSASWTDRASCAGVLE